MRSRTSDRRRMGFTLVELLVVIGIISVLISILLPVLGSVRRQGIKAKCAAQMRDMGMAMQMYAQENKGYLPPVRISTSYTIDSLTYHKGGTESIPLGVINENAKWWHFVARYVSKIKPMPQTDAEMGAFRAAARSGAPALSVSPITPALPSISSAARIEISPASG